MAALSTLLNLKHGAGAMPVKKLLHHLQCNSVFFDITDLPADQFRPRQWATRSRQRQCTLWEMGLLILLPRRLSYHDPVGIGALPRPLLPHPDVGILGVQLQARQRRGRRLLAFPEFGPQDFRQALGWGRGLGGYLSFRSQRLGYREVSFGVPAVH